MAELIYANESQDFCEKFLTVFPGAVKEANRIKAEEAVEYQLPKKHLYEAAKGILLEALVNAFPKSFGPATLRLTDPIARMRLAAPRNKGSLKNPVINVRRWDIPRTGPKRPVKKILALLVSPSRSGITDRIMDAMLDGARQEGCSIEKLYISDLAIAPCSGCLACEAQELKNYCTIQDDMTGIYDKFLESDGFVLGFPVYKARECSQEAVFLDRLKAVQAKVRATTPGGAKKAGLVVTWGWPADDSYNHDIENAASALKLFNVETTEVITGCEPQEACYHQGLARMDEQGMSAARQAGRALVAG